VLFYERCFEGFGVYAVRNIFLFFDTVHSYYFRDLELEQMTRDDRQLAALRRENDELRAMHQLDMAEIVRLRRWIEALEQEREAPMPASPPPEKQRVWRKYQKHREEAAHGEA
jgi:hypothetical protein